MNKTIFFISELEKISNENLRKFTEELINKADDYFFFIPASTTGKHHPEFDLGTGGLVRHTKVVTYMAQALGTAHMLDQDSIDILTIAAIAHDIKKIGTGSSGYTMKNHPKLAEEFIRSVYSENNLDIPEQTIDEICKCVLCHMGQWGDDKPTTSMELILHSADYIASRKELQAFDFGEFPEYSKDDFGEIVIPFGKYKGTNIRDLCENQSGYVKWIVNGDFNPTYKNLILEYLKK